MGFIELYTSTPNKFAGSYRSFEKSRYVVTGIPFDKTSTYRPGSRFAPAAIREASLNIETYSFRSGVDVEDVAICDVGDLHVVDAVDETLRRVQATVREIRDAVKIPVLIGGEHTITLGAIKAFEHDAAILSLDAHADLRDEYSGSKIMHATFMRRIVEHLGPERVVEVGLRAVSREELKYLRDSEVKFLTTHELLKRSPSEAAAAVKDTVKKSPLVYLTIDMDVFDPAYAPGVGNPEPDGLSPDYVLSIVNGVCGERVVGVDVVEVSPNYDNGITAALAAKVLFEVISAIEATRLKKQ